jgi:hypothetical protein
VREFGKKPNSISLPARPRWLRPNAMEARDGNRVARALAVACVLALCACGDGESDASLEGDSADAGASDALRPRDDEEVPAITSRAVLNTWLAKRYYRRWSCETAPRATSVALHGRMRTCRNEILRDPSVSGEYHVGAAAISELVDGAGTVIGTALVVRGLPDPGPTGWYFYERWSAPAALALHEPIEPDGTVADGFGDAGGNAQTLCAACHAKAARDFVHVPGT